MSERKINLEEIIEKFWKEEYSEDMKDFSEIFYPIFGRMIKGAMKEACRQSLELAAENAEAKVWYDSNENEYYPIIDKQAILDTINQIE